MSKRKPWSKISSKIIHRNPWFALRKDQVLRPNGQQGTYHFITLPPSVFIVPMTNSNKVCLIQQYRYPTQTYSWEIPGGSSANKNILTAAKKELREETGFLAKKWIKVGIFHCQNGISNEVAHVFIAKGIIKTRVQSMKEEGIKKLKKVTFKKVQTMIEKGEIMDSQTISALTLSGLKLGYIH